jgi:hypothetical protein
MRFTKLSQSMLCVARYPRTMYLTLLPHILKFPIPCQNVSRYVSTSIFFWCLNFPHSLCSTSLLFSVRSCFPLLKCPVYEALLFSFSSFTLIPWSGFEMNFWERCLFSLDDVLTERPDFFVSKYVWFLKCSLLGLLILVSESQVLNTEEFLNPIFFDSG